MIAELKIDKVRTAVLHDDGLWSSPDRIMQRTLNMLFSPLRNEGFVSRATPDWGLLKAGAAAEFYHAVLVVPDSGGGGEGVVY